MQEVLIELSVFDVYMQYNSVKIQYITCQNKHWVQRSPKVFFGCGLENVLSFLTF